LLAASLLSLSSVANAGLVSLNFGSVSADPSFQRTAGTATATFFNPEGGNFLASSGLVVGSGGLPEFFDVSFDQDIELISYTTNFNAGTLTFDITGSGVSSLGNTLASADFVGQPLSIQAGQTYHVQANFAGTGNITRFLTWNLDDAPASVPAPTTLLLLLTGLASGAWLRRRRS